MTIFTDGPRQTTSFLEDFSISTGEVLGTFADDAIKFSPTSSIRRAQLQLDAQEGELTGTGVVGGIMDPLAGQSRTQPATEVLSVADQQERIDAEGVRLKPVEGLRLATLDILIARKKEEAASASAIERATGFQMVAGFGAGLVVSVFDPLNVVSAFIPVVGPARYAALLAKQTTRTGRALLRARVGALEGGVGAAVVEPIVAAQAFSEQADYTIADILLNIAFGTGLGGGLHTGFGALGDSIKAREARVRTIGDEAKAYADLTPEQQIELARAQLALALEDRNIVIGPSLFDLLDNPRLADAGITDTGQAAGLKIEFTEETTTINGVTIAADIEARARVDSPVLFKKIDKLKAEQKNLRAEVNKLTVGRTDNADATRIDAELLALREKQLRQTKRNAKKTQAKIATLELERQELLTRLRENDTPEQVRIRKKLTAADEKLRDTAVEASDAFRAAGEALGKPLKPEPQSILRATGLSFEDTARVARAPENLRLTDFKALEENAELYGGLDDRKTLAEAQAETAEILQELDSFTKELDDTTVGAAVRRVIDAETENIKLAEGHADALLAAFKCRVR